MVEYHIFFEGVACFIHKVNMYLRIIRVDFSSALVNRHKYGFNARSGLSHQTGGSRRSNCQTGNVTASVFEHVFIQFRISFFQAVDEGVVFFSFAVIDSECTAFFCHFYRRTICFQGNRFMHFFREFGCFFSSVA